MDLEQVKRKLEEQNSVEPELRISQSHYQKIILARMGRDMLAAFILLVVAYLCFAATIIRFVPTQFGLVLTKNNTYGGGILPPNAQALVTPGVNVSTTLGGRLKEGFFPNNKIVWVKVLAGPTGSVTWNRHHLKVNGKRVAAYFSQPLGVPYLDNQYIGVCLKGACQRGAGILFSASNVVGLPVHKERG